MSADQQAGAAKTPLDGENVLIIIIISVPNGMATHVRVVSPDHMRVMSPDDAPESLT